ncbi:hypothetical protein HQ585_18065 [candidate division KSB1 bacterium]|nr:hypothetical protein [candidate division KSB1 bacterium]
MSEDNIKMRGLRNLPILATGVLFLVSFYLVILKVIRPAAIYVKQMPVFVSTSHAFHEALAYPGGLIDYISSGFMLYFVKEWIGALFLTILCLMIFILITALLQKRTLLKGFWGLPFLPCLALAMMLTNYDRPLADTMSLTLALGVFWITQQFNKKSLALRLILLFVLGCMLYYLTPGGFLLFLVLIIISQIPTLISSPINIILIGLAGAFAWILPTLAYQWIFLISKKEAFLAHLPWMQNHPVMMPFILFIILLFGSILLASIRIEPKVGKGNRILNHPVTVIAQMILIPVLTVLLVTATVNKTTRKIHEIRYLAHENRWRDVLAAMDVNAIRHVTCMTLINQALYHTNQLASNMFAYPQAWETSGLILPADIAYEYPLDHSHIVYDMGHVTEAERWAAEALVLYGQTPWVIEHQALINILQEDWAAADKYLQVMGKIGPTRERAAHYLDIVKDPERLRYEYRLQQLKALRPENNFVTSINYPQKDFEALLQQNPENKMAYEYLMAHSLLAKDFQTFAKFLPKYKDFNYHRMPRHFQEALVVYVAQKGKVDLPGFQPDQRILQRFNEFRQVAQQTRSYGNAGIQQLKEQFGDTYWYYLIYTQIESG